MTQAEFNAWPLLLPRAAVFAALPDLTQRALYEYRADGDLRVFEPDPEGTRYRHGYYYKSDVGRIHGGLRLEFQYESGEDGWLETGAFCAASGLCREAVDRACACGQLVALRHGPNGGWRRFWARDLEWFW